jgi:hypothetical protein
VKKGKKKNKLKQVRGSCRKLALQIKKKCVLGGGGMTIFSRCPLFLANSLGTVRVYNALCEQIMGRFRRTSRRQQSMRI